MPRPSKCVVDYFPHFVRSGKTMFTLEARFGNDGYAFWFKLLEMLGGADGHFLDLNKPDDWEFLLAKTRVSDVIADGILSMLSRLDAIDAKLWGSRLVWSQNFVEFLMPVYKRRSVSAPTKPCDGGLCIQKPTLSGVSDDIYPQSKVKESKGKKTNTAAPEKPDALPKQVIPGPPGFAEFWAAYPRKIDKSQAAKTYQARIRDGATPEDLLLAAQNYAAHCLTNKTEVKFIKHPKTFLNPDWRQWLEKETERALTLSERIEKEGLWY